MRTRTRISRPIAAFAVLLAAIALGSAVLHPQTDYSQARKWAIQSQQYNMNWLHPGCGTGMEAAYAAGKNLDAAIERKPVFLGRLLHDQTPSVRAFAILSIGWRRVDGFNKDLAGILCSDKDPKCREFAAAALGRCRGSDHEPALRKALENPAIEVRITACAALLALGEEVPMTLRKRLNKEANRKMGIHDVTLLHLFQHD